MDPFKPIELFADIATHQWLHFAPSSYAAKTTHFFIYDTIKIGLLLVVINDVMAIVRYYFPLEKTRNILAKRRWYGLDYLFAALLGVVTPFCSCSSIPLFIGFLGAGIPLGVTFSFLISSPLINESSLYLFPALFGLRVTLFYNLFGIAVAVAGGLLIQKLDVGHYVLPDLLKIKSREEVEREHGGGPLSLRRTASLFWREGMAITKQIFPYMVLGVGIGAFIHGFVPRGFVERYFSAKTWWSIPLVTLLGAPFYANSVSVLPVMEALVGKGVPLGTALTFMTSIVTISIPEALILKKVMRWPLLGLFFGITIIGIMAMGFLFNAIL
ncbi:MAG TPA: permease [Elusimicrobiota bacterium]|nr:permease [Elusimicrobiota bacterium]